MRNRFFVIILATLVFSVIGITLVHIYFFRVQKLNLIDQQIQQVSGVLLGSHDFALALDNPKLMEETINRVLKSARIGKVFVLRDRSANILSESFNLNLLGTTIPIEPEWVQVQTENQYVRVRNIPVAGHKDLIMQVGLVLDKNFIDWEIINSRVLYYIVILAITLFASSIFLTLVLLSPLRTLVAHLREAAASLVQLRDISPLPRTLTTFTDGFLSRTDEFAALLATIQRLIDRVNLNIKLKRSWTLQMAHELKTPLAIIRAETEAKLKAGVLPETYAQDVVHEIKQMSDTISQFLDWADLENSHLQRDLPSLRIKTVVKSVSSRLEKLFPGRIRLHVDHDYSVVANPIHLDQVISNLMTNALKFSPTDRQVDIFLTPNTLVVKDFGRGVPREVRERLGEPFNVGSNDDQGATGNGLGLAWVFGVAKLYHWYFEIHSDSGGTDAVLRFPREDD